MVGIPQVHLLRGLLTVLPAVAVLRKVNECHNVIGLMLTVYLKQIDGGLNRRFSVEQVRRHMDTRQQRVLFQNPFCVHVSLTASRVLLNQDGSIS